MLMKVKEKRLKMEARNTLFRRLERGSSMIEVLVSMLILAGGILGMNALQTSSLKSNQNSYIRVLANTYALDIVERMRANPAGAVLGSYNNPTPALNSNCLTTTGCTSAQMALHDVSEWETLISTNLPSGSGTICLDSTPNDGTTVSVACDNTGSIYAVKIWWDANRDGTADRNYIMTFRP